MRAEKAKFVQKLEEQQAKDREDKETAEDGEENDRGPQNFFTIVLPEQNGGQRAKILAALRIRV